MSHARVQSPVIFGGVITASPRTGVVEQQRFTLNSNNDYFRGPKPKKQKPERAQAVSKPKTVSESSSSLKSPEPKPAIRTPKTVITVTKPNTPIPVNAVHVPLSDDDILMQDAALITRLLVGRLDGIDSETFQALLIGDGSPGVETFKTFCHPDTSRALANLRITREMHDLILRECLVLEKLDKIAETEEGRNDLRLADDFVSGLPKEQNTFEKRLQVVEFLQRCKRESENIRFLNKSEQFIRVLSRLNSCEVKGTGKLFDIANDQLNKEPIGLAGHFFHAEAASALRQSGYKKMELCRDIIKNGRPSGDFDIVCERENEIYIFEVKSTVFALKNDQTISEIEEIIKACQKGNEVRIPGLIIGYLTNHLESLPLTNFLRDFHVLARRNSFNPSDLKVFSIDDGELRSASVIVHKHSEKPALV